MQGGARSQVVAKSWHLNFCISLRPVHPGRLSYDRSTGAVCRTYFLITKYSYENVFKFCASKMH